MFYTREQHERLRQHRQRAQQGADELLHPGEPVDAWRARGLDAVGRKPKVGPKLEKVCEEVSPRPNPCVWIYGT